MQGIKAKQGFTGLTEVWLGLRLGEQGIGQAESGLASLDAVQARLRRARSGRASAKKAIQAGLRRPRLRLGLAGHIGQVEAWAVHG